MFWIFVWTFTWVPICHSFIITVCGLNIHSFLSENRFYQSSAAKQEAAWPSANSVFCIALWNGHRTFLSHWLLDHHGPLSLAKGIEALNDGLQSRKKRCSSLKGTHVCTRPYCLNFCLFFTIWTQSCRVGEATNPGPGETSTVDRNILNIGSLNTTGIYDKHDQIRSLGRGIWSICETHATVRTQKIFSQKMKPEYHCAFTNPVKSIGSASGYRGIASGVACVTTLPIRTIRTGIPETVHSTCRFLTNHVTINSSTTLLVVSVYGPATGISTIAEPQQLLNDLLNTATSVASRWNGPAVVLGDFNTDPDQYAPIQALFRNGWIDAHNESHKKHGHSLNPTCILAHGTSRHSRIYINSQCARSFIKCDTWNDNLFPGHPALVLQCNLTMMTQRLTTWKLPRTFDSYCINAEAASEYQVHCSHQVEVFKSNLQQENLDEASKIWSTMCEATLAESARNQVGNKVFIPKSHFGRGDGPKLSSNNPSLPTIREGRDGDFNPGWGQCSLHLRQVCRQARRITNLIHLSQARIRSPTAANEASCVALWNAICNAPGFSKPFPLWYVDFAHESFPLQIPDIDSLQRIKTIFQGFCDNISNEHRQNVKTQTKRFFDDDWEKGGSKTFAQIKEDPLPNLPFVVQTITSKVKKVAWRKQGSNTLFVDSPQLFNIGDHVTFQGQEATITKILDKTITVDCTLYLRNQDHSIKLKKFVYCPKEANQKIADAWNCFFQKDCHTPIDSWENVENILPQLPQNPVAELPELQVELWRRVHSDVSKRSARGPCGFSVYEMHHLPSWILELLFLIFNEIHQGKPWPQQWVKAYTVFLPKTRDPQTLIDNRPITILSRVYRMWSRFYSITLLVHLSSTVPKTIGGGTREVSALMMTSYVQEVLETQKQQKIFAAGLVIDLVKCFNTIPRYPLALFMSKAGWPTFLIHSYLRALHQMERSFIILGESSTWHRTHTGIPEGCPLAVPAMLTLSITAFNYVRYHNPNIEFQAFADNWAMLFSAISQVAQGVAIMEQFCNLLKLQVSVPKSWLWSIDGKQANALRDITLQGSVIPVVDEAKDLGVDISYGKKKSKQHLQKRLKLGLERLAKLKTIKTTTKRRAQVLKNGCFAKATYGAELQNLPKKIFNDYRIASSRALGRGRSGASPWLSLSLVDRIVGFEYGELESKFFFWRRYLRIFPLRVHEICHKLESLQPSRGPVGAFKKTGSKFFTWGPGGLITSQWFGTINWMKCSKRFLKHILQTHWNIYACQQLTHRKAFEAIAIDLTSYTKAISHVPGHHACAMAIHSCGTHFANDALCHIDGSSNQCPYCDSQDSPEHRLLFCPAFSSERVDTFGFENIAALVTSTTMRHFCLLPLPESVLDFKKLLTSQYQVVHPSLEDRQKIPIFADGSCFFPKDKYFSVAGSAIVLAKENPHEAVTLNRQLLPGGDHTPHRAEIFGIILSLETGPVLEIWCDCAAVVGDLQTMISFLQKGNPLDTPRPSRPVGNHTKHDTGSFQ